MPRILIASPIRQKPAILSEFLKSLAELELPGIEVEYAFVDDNEDPVSSRILRDFKPGPPVRLLDPLPVAERYTTDAATHHWLPALMSRVGTYKDQFLEIAPRDAFDGVFLVDSDLILHPRTLAKLSANNVAICSEIFWTQWNAGGHELPQVWMHDQYSLFARGREEPLTNEEVSSRVSAFLRMLREPGVYEVGGLGACTLIRRDAIERGARFREIPNIQMIGEDRDFCIRAAALGIPLHVDTHHPALHLYRIEDLARVAEFKRANRRSLEPSWRKESGNKIVLSMLVRNEAGRYLERTLAHAASYVDEAVIVDDASTDETVAVCRRVLANLPHTIVSLGQSRFDREHELRELQWRHTLAAKPDWILNLDADEIFDDSIRAHIRSLVDQTSVDAIYMRLYDMWNERQYREDDYWRAHDIYRPFLVRPTPRMVDAWDVAHQHAGRFPGSIEHLEWWTCSIRLKHLGWMRPEDRIEKMERYRRHDPDGKWGSAGQYASILDPDPHLIDWID